MLHYLPPGLTQAYAGQGEGAGHAFCSPYQLIQGSASRAGLVAASSAKYGAFAQVRSAITGPSEGARRSDGLTLEPSQARSP